MYMPQFGTEAVAVFRSFSSVHVLIVDTHFFQYLDSVAHPLPLDSTIRLQVALGVRLHSAS